MTFLSSLEAKIFPTTDDVQRFKKLKTCILDTGREYKELHIESVKFFKQMVILKFKEITSIDELMPYKGRKEKSGILPSTVLQQFPD